MVCIQFEDGYSCLVRNAIQGWEKIDYIQTAIGRKGRYQHQLGTDLIIILPSLEQCKFFFFY